MIPLPRMLPVAQKRYEEGRVYRFDVEEIQSERSRGHYYATLRDLWGSIPERYGDRWPTPEHLRKYALIATGHFSQRVFSLTDQTSALRLASYIKSKDEFAVVLVTDSTVTEYTAKSQSPSAMGHKLFQQSKTDCLDYVNHLIEEG